MLASQRRAPEPWSVHLPFVSVGKAHQDFPGAAKLEPRLSRQGLELELDYGAPCAGPAVSRAHPTQSAGASGLSKLKTKKPQRRPSTTS